ncbi:MAG: ROK family protein [Gammaproteobacteria bacterium]|nr:ROK family protein [Gammaproteobacteria bacterium]
MIIREIEMNKNYRIGVDLGGTKIEAMVLNQQGREISRMRVATPKGDYRKILLTIADLVEEVENDLNEVATIGICTPGALSPATGLLKNSNTVCMNGKPVYKDLVSLLGREIRIANDANCFALSEAVDGAAAGAEVVFGVIVGTGTGGGIVINQKLLTGTHAIAGEWGHNPLPWPDEQEFTGPDCYCGKKGCIETYLSGPAITRDHQAHGGDKVSAEEIVELAALGFERAEETLCRYEERMAKSLASVINLLDPDVIVLGGGMSNIERLYTNVPKLLPAYVFSDEVHTSIVAPKFGDSSGVRGAAWLW